MLIIKCHISFSLTFSLSNKMMSRYFY